ncbi:hypothetical protein [Spiroplasma taiwanense]|uniref:Uncharacterized protein n=1 Tax=Spiroplasma taiwanense CT-1 TaxID=1276220 RepID=S5LTR7_9MOLU|nr:hypothetical protein [Spiroplasma taiwanense]AGR41109.1 hypothetical protein STAIW_v1c04660 [Spiroplasma taiwanense CT-1]
MKIKKIILKNFIVPGEQIFEFNDQNILKSGIFHDQNDLKIVNQLLNGNWFDSSLSFEKYYPKFAKKLDNEKMNFQIDALFYISQEELKILNSYVKKLEILIPLKSQIYYYSIKCIYPYIFPIVSIIPAEKNGDKPFGLGIHYDKFFKSNLTKKDILTIAGISAVGQLRDKYFKYKDAEVNGMSKEIYNRYLELIKSVFRYSEQFIAKLGQTIFNMDDGDIINYGEQKEYFFRNEKFIEFLDNIPLLSEDKVVREDFCNLLYEIYLKDLQWIYSVKSANDIIEIRENIYNNFCEKAIYSKELINFFRTELILDNKVFDFNSAINEFKKKIDESLVFKGELKVTKAFEKGSSDVTSTEEVKEIILNKKRKKKKFK